MKIRNILIAPMLAGALVFGAPVVATAEPIASNAAD